MIKNQIITITVFKKRKLKKTFILLWSWFHHRWNLRIKDWGGSENRPFPILHVPEWSTAPY